MSRGFNSAISNLYGMADRTKIALAAYAQTQVAPRLENDARQNAPWHDISRAAREGLKAGTVIRGDKIIIYLAHSVSYGPFLELAHDAKYAIIDPTIEKNKDWIFDGYERILKTVP